MIDPRQPSPQDLKHDALFYGDDETAMNQKVVGFLAQGIQGGGAALAIVSDEHERALAAGLKALSIDPGSPTLRERLIFLNAHEVLASIFVNGHAQKTRFSRLVGNQVRSMTERYELCAYGEMVGILRSLNDDRGAEQVEALWNDLLHAIPFTLLCGYPISLLDPAFQSERVDTILRSHRSVTSTLSGFEAALEHGIAQAMGSRAPDVHAALRQRLHPEWAALPDAESAILWLRENLPAHADEIVFYARQHFATLG